MTKQRSEVKRNVMCLWDGDQRTMIEYRVYREEWEVTKKTGKMA